MSICSVSQIISNVKGLLERDDVLQDVWVNGEISNLALPGSGHAYFTLKDNRAALRCVMFRNVRGTERLDEGASVIVHGRFSLYEVRGDLQFIVDIVQPEGVGELQLKLEQLKLKLDNEGFFDASRKRSLPEFPERIGVITSPSGAVWQDIKSVINRRYPMVQIVLAPTLVQGDDASRGIVEAFRAMNKIENIDLVILARGGGSIEDLWPFNDEMVARSIYSSRVPVISAIGHETDVTVADLVADQRAPTPSAAAVMAVPDKLELFGNIQIFQQSMVLSVARNIRQKVEFLTRCRAQLMQRSPDVDGFRLHIDDMLKSVGMYLKLSHQVRHEKLTGLKLRLGSLSPRDTLRRGYAIVQNLNSPDVIIDSSQVIVGDQVNITLSDGDIDAEITSIRSNDSD